MARKSPAFVMAVLLVSWGGTLAGFPAEEASGGEKIKLPPPQETSDVSIEEALWQRRSVRAFSAQTPTWEQVAQLLWAGQGINRPGANRRTAPSAGALYPMVLYVVLPDGVYRYLPEEHAVIKTKTGDTRKMLSEAGLGQSALYESPCIFVLCAVFEKTASKYKDQAPRYIYEEAGHIAQNLLLQVISLGMGGVPIGAVIGPEAQKALDIPEGQEVVYVVATGFEKKP
ncbi:MAG TPA: SagB/ThcOx family dehydrogenase [bacterium]|nr:SagB/ThcOx family dehydrogenase [Candidatus Omnitrophota bacterium]HOJ62273.1 SagB/ThcOx family dehydrogenase [bacterium]HOL96654.1 SagB/ThcOx family dehydrogenase [bacterium]HPP02055.1 SagB/ThcOx family dehydrogenase [bacterium]